MTNDRSQRTLRIGAMLFGAAFLPLSMACAQTAAPAGAKNFLTVDGKAPLIIGHRGVPGSSPKRPRPLMTSPPRSEPTRSKRTCI